MNQWEYERVDIDLQASDANKLGTEDWELVGFDRYGRAWFKRDIDAHNKFVRHTR